MNDFGDVQLVAIDPITAFMGHGRGFDSHRASDVRSQLHPLSRLAEKLGVGFSAVTHPPKNAGSAHSAGQLHRLASLHRRRPRRTLLHR